MWDKMADIKGLKQLQNDFSFKKTNYFAIIISFTF